MSVPILLESFKNDSQNPTLKIAFLMTTPHRGYIISKTNHEPIDLHQKLITFNCGFEFTIGNFFYELTGGVMERIVEAGIPEHLLKFHNRILYKRKSKKKVMPQILTVNDLSFGFIIWLVACGISFLILIIELFAPKLFKILRFLSGSMLVLHTINQRLRSYLG